MKESFLFMAHTVTRWRTTGAIAPSGRALARTIARAAGNISQGQVVVELGPGTGVTTREIVKHFPNNRIIAIEIIDVFAAQLEKTFPSVTVVRGDASQLEAHLKALGIAPENVGAILSGLPLLAFPPDLSSRILASIRGHPAARTSLRAVHVLAAGVASIRRRGLPGDLVQARLAQRPAGQRPHLRANRRRRNSFLNAP